MYKTEVILEPWGAPVRIASFWETTSTDAKNL